MFEFIVYVLGLITVGMVGYIAGYTQAEDDAMLEKYILKTLLKTRNK